MEIDGIALKQSFRIRRLCTVHYFEFSKNYFFVGEKHDFWELVYVDKGEILATAGDREFPLRQGEALFHCPDEWHNIRANGTVAANVMIVTFVCTGAAMDRFVGAKLPLTDAEKKLLSGILSESHDAFSSPLDDPNDNQLRLADDAPFGSQQMIGAYLTQLLISLSRRPAAKPVPEPKFGSATRLAEIRDYMLQHLSEKMTLSRLADAFHVSQSYLKKLFADAVQCGAMHYFLGLRAERAKELLRESDRNISQLAEELGYENVYYFSSQFRRFTGMSPTEYRRSVKALDEKGRRRRGEP